ncbi:MAG: haloacid dehalogenase [Hydrogenophilales bacterium 28-61-23]|nr:MAG: haloacid dehalogenase [Hydrogenophilales bacterium 28-61-23]
MYRNHDRMIIIDADGTVIDAFTAIGKAFSHHGMELGDLDRFQKRRNLFKYLGGLKEFPRNLAKHFGKYGRKDLLATLTDIYRDEALLYPGMANLIRDLFAAPNIRVGMVTRNVTHEPEITLERLFARHDLDIKALDFLHHIPLRQEKTPYFKAARARFDINPARAYACGDEHKDFTAAIASGMHPFIVSYGFENLARLTRKFAIPEEIIAETPIELSLRIRHGLDLPT